MPPQRQISKNNNHLFRYLIFQRSKKSSLTNSTLINPSKAAFKEPAPRTIPSTQQNYTQTTSPTLRPIPHSARYPPRIDQKVARMARARHPKRARSSESVPRAAAAFFDGLSVEKSRIQHDSSKRSWHRRPVERDVGISAVLSSKPRLSLERARRRRARIPALPTGPSCCATLSSGQIVSTKTRDPAAGHRTRMLIIGSRVRVLARVRTRSRAERIRTSCERQGEFVPFQNGIVTLLQNWRIFEFTCNVVQVGRLAGSFREFLKN